MHYLIRMILITVTMLTNMMCGCLILSPPITERARENIFWCSTNSTEHSRSGLNTVRRDILIVILSVAARTRFMEISEMRLNLRCALNSNPFNYACSRSDHAGSPGDYVHRGDRVCADLSRHLSQTQVIFPSILHKAPRF
jgi:hypothetical protein